MRQITIAPARGLSFVPAEIATEVVASLGNRGGGKSNGAARIAELLLEAGVPVIVLDYVGIWFSLRLAPNGKSASPFQIPVLGGRHGDIALMASSGAVVAEALARTQSSAILDISMFSKADRCRFATDFAEAFFRAKKDHPGPVQLLLEEAQRFVPQKLFTGQERMLGAFEEIAEVGRNYGIGLHLISQRPQKINKDVLNLSDTVFGYRTNGVLERKAIADWVQEKGAAGRADVQNELPGLERGSAIVWSPSRKIFGHFAIEKKTTYDAGATPIAARAAVKTKALDLNSLETAMGAAVEEAKANDPRVLRARIAQLERAAETRPAATAKPGKVVHVPIFREADLKRIEKLADRLAGGSNALEVAADKLCRVAEDVGAGRMAMQKTLQELVEAGRRAMAPPTRIGTLHVPGRAPEDIPAPVLAPRPTRTPTPAPRARAAAPAVAGGYAVTKGARTALTALAQHREGLTRRKLGILTGYAPAGTSMREILALCRKQDDEAGKEPWVEDMTDGTIRVNGAGLAVLGPYDALPSGPRLRDHWLRELPAAASRMLAALCAVYPQGLTKLGLEEATAADGRGKAYQANGTSMREGLACLRGMELVDDAADRIIASADLF